MIYRALLLLLLTAPALAQEPFKPITLERSDIESLNTILSEQIPPKWGALIVKWIQDIQARQAKKEEPK